MAIIRRLENVHVYSLLSSDNDKGPCTWKVENWAENDDFFTGQTVLAVASTIVFCLSSNFT